jgi:hypothetical protein
MNCNAACTVPCVELLVAVDSLSTSCGMLRSSWMEHRVVSARGSSIMLGRGRQVHHRRGGGARPVAVVHPRRVQRRHRWRDGSAVEPQQPPQIVRRAPPQRAWLLHPEADDGAHALHHCRAAGRRCVRRAAAAAGGGGGGGGGGGRSTAQSSADTSHEVWEELNFASLRARSRHPSTHLLGVCRVCRVCAVCVP